MSDIQNLLDPVAISRLENLQLKAKSIVEGFLTGLHNSPYHGFSIEFSQHRQYMPGDSLKHLDYKVLAKTGRYYVKQYEEETNLKAYILLDHSGSMGYKSSGITKLEYGKTLAAAISLLLLKQRDAVGLVTFRDKVKEIMPPSSAMGWLDSLLIRMTSLDAEGETKVSAALLNIAERIKRKGLVILISDLLDDPEDIMAGLRALRHIGHEVIVFQIFDPMEISFGFGKDARFKDLEGDNILPSRPWHVQKEYRKLIQSFIEYYSNQCRIEQIDFKMFTTDISYGLALYEFMDRRRRLF